MRDKTYLQDKNYGLEQKIIPGGNMMLSKRPEMFLPDKWPNVLFKSKGLQYMGYG